MTIVVEVVAARQRAGSTCREGTVPLQIASRDDRGATIVTVSGDIDVQTAPALRAALAQLTPSHDLVLDLGGVDFLDSSALGIVIGVNKTFDPGPGRFSLVCDKPNLVRVFQITRLTDVLRIVDTVEDALA